MTGKKLIGMAVALVLLVVIAVLQKNNGNAAHSAGADKDAKLLAGIDLNAVTSIDVSQGSNAVALVKRNGKWVVGSLYDYPANFKSLARAIRTAAEVKLGSPVRAGNVAESEFGLGTEAKKVVLKAGGKTVATIMVGAKRKASESAGNADQVFIRKDDDSAIYLVDYDFEPFSTDAKNWIDRQLLSVSRGDLVEVKTDDVDLNYDGKAWTLAGLNPATEEFQQREANRMFMAMQYLSCESVANPTKSDADLGFDKTFHYTARTRDGFTYSATLGKTTAHGRYARFKVVYSKPKPPTAPAKDADKAAQDKYKTALDTYNTTTAANAKKAAELNARLSNWTYVIGSYYANSFTVKRDALAKKKTPPAKKDAAAAKPVTVPPTTVTSAPVAVPTAK